MLHLVYLSGLLSKVAKKLAEKISTKKCILQEIVRMFGIFLGRQMTGHVEVSVVVNIDSSKTVFLLLQVPVEVIKVSNTMLGDNIVAGQELVIPGAGMLDEY